MQENNVVAPELAQEESIKLSIPKVSFTEYRKEISSSRKILRSISSSYRIRNCQRYSNGNTSDQTIIVDGSGQVVEARFSKLAICGRASCPNCGQMRGMKAERQIEALIKAAQHKGGRAQLIVSTSRSAARLDHDELMQVQAKAYAKFLAKMNGREKSKFNVAGIVHMPEISYTEAGINPHSNVVIIYSAHVPDITMKQVEDIYARIWIDTHIAEGLPRPTRKNGVVAQEIFDPTIVSGYLTKSYKHGFPRSLFNNGWFKENGDLDDSGNGNVRNPHDILRLINGNQKLRKFFINMDKQQEIVRLGGLEFGLLNKQDGSITELDKLPKIIRHWYDYETATKGKNIISVTKAVPDSERSNEQFWAEVHEMAEESMRAPSDDSRVTITVSYDLQKWVESRSSVDDLIIALNSAALSIEPSENTEESIRTALSAAMDSWEERKGKPLREAPIAA